MLVCHLCEKGISTRHGFTFTSNICCVARIYTFLSCIISGPQDIISFFTAVIYADVVYADLTAIREK